MAAVFVLFASCYILSPSAFSVKLRGLLRHVDLKKELGRCELKIEPLAQRLGAFSLFPLIGEGIEAPQKPGNTDLFGGFEFLGELDDFIVQMHMRLFVDKQ